MRIIITIFVLFLLSFSAFALKETNLSFLYTLLEKKNFYTMGKFQGSGNFDLQYAKFGKGKGKNGSLIFVNGKGENILKYIELFYDFHLKGWSPIYTYDHRGQGFSELIRPDSQPIYKTNDSIYSIYKKDFETFIKLVLKDKEIDSSRLFLIAHSMGGTIVLNYLQAHPTQKLPFQSITLSAPMIKMQSLVSPSLLKIFLNGYCFLMPCAWKFSSLRGSSTQKTFTDSQARYDFSKYVVTKAFPGSYSKGTSFRWIIDSLEITDQLMKKKNIHSYKVPVLILQSKKDMFVSNESQNSFCKANPSCCYIREFDGKHEIFMEADHWRNQAIKIVTEFFMDSKRYKKKCRSI